ncbi:MAG: EF-P lysine aminoacylase GenX [Alphaproteobacteria bacterium]|nr:EF-P lysine aminoacylase GenX [Alphaproteobacteria bacterium]
MQGNFEIKQQNLKTRQRLIRAVRRFFDAHGFDEVETPALQIMPGAEVHVQAFETMLINPHQDRAETRYLHTSPEFAMKKLLAAGWERLYQICHVFRNAEGSPWHSPEFTMIEWYRAHAGYRDIMADCVDLLRAVATACDITEYRYQDMSADPFVDWEIISVAEAFERYAGIELIAYLPQNVPVDGFREILQQKNLHTAPDDTWDDLFMRVMGTLIEPRLGQGRPTIVYDYPVSLAALARPKPEDARFAERFELYVCGVELANAFGELTDAAEQRRRMEADMGLKESLYGKAWPIDEAFLAALERGMPESGGIALGIDRLVMLACGASDIKAVLWEA